MKRPQKFHEIIGQEQVKKRLRYSITSAKKRNVALSHILFSGPPGTGKSTFSTVIANELEVPIQIANAANIRSIKTILPYLLRIEQHSILFIDEIHRLTRIVEEFIYPVMEDFRIDFVTEEEPFVIYLPPFTLVGATTLAGILSRPFHDRFQIHEALSLYTIEELTQLVLDKSKSINISLDNDSAYEIARRSRGTPRVAQNLLAFIRDISITTGESITPSMINDGLNLKGVNENGLNINDQRYIEILQNRYNGGPVSLETLSNALQIEKETIINVIEPFLVWKNLIIKTSRGRILK